MAPNGSSPNKNGNDKSKQSKDSKKNKVDDLNKESIGVDFKSCVDDIAAEESPSEYKSAVEADISSPSPSPSSSPFGSTQSKIHFDASGKPIGDLHPCHGLDGACIPLARMMKINPIKPQTSQPKNTSKAVGSTIGQEPSDISVDGGTQVTCITSEVADIKSVEKQSQRKKPSVKAGKSNIKSNDHSPKSSATSSPTDRDTHSQSAINQKAALTPSTAPAERVASTQRISQTKVSTTKLVKRGRSSNQLKIKLPEVYKGSKGDSK